MRAAAALALARCGDDGDAALLLADLGSGPEAGARLMAAAALGSDVASPARAFLTADDPVTRACAACAIGLGSKPQPIGKDTAAVLAEAIASADNLPPTWGWRWRVGPVANTQTMACAVLRSSGVTRPKAVVQALSAIDDLDQLAADTLGGLAFPFPPM